VTRKERGEIRTFFKGHPAYVPQWVLILQAADFDPLRAQEIEERLTGRWWNYYQVATRERTKVERAQARKVKRGN